MPFIFMMAEMVNIDYRLNEICQAYFILVPRKAYKEFNVYSEEKIVL